MAQYFHDFADGITGWTQRTLTTGHTAPAWSVVSTDQLQATSTSNRNEMLAWDSIDSDADRDDIEVFAQVYVSSAARRCLAVRIVGSGSVNGYTLALGASSIEFQRIETGAFLTLASASVSFTADTWVNVRFRINGTSAYLRAWADGDSEPGTWDIDGTAATAYTAAGYVGPCKHSDTSTQLWRYFGVGTNGDSAPDSAGGSADLPTLSTVSASSVTATGFAPAVAYDYSGGTNGNSPVAYWISSTTAAWTGTPTGAQIAAGNQSDNSAATYSGSESAPGSGSGTITEATATTGASASTAYTIAWVVYDDVSLTYSNVVTGEITTSAASIAGVLSATLGAASLVATGQLAIAGALSGTLGAATLSSAAVLALSGALSATLGEASLSAAGESSAPGSGSLSVTLSDAGLSAAGVLYLSGALSETLGDASLSAAGALAIDGELTATLDDASLSAQGEQLLPISGVLTATLEDATLEAYENEPVSSGILEIDWEPGLWWKRKPKALPEKVAREKLKKAATVIAKKAEEQVKADVVAEKEQRKAEAKEAVRPMLAEMPGFDWQALYDEAYSRALNAAVAQAMREQEAMAQAKAAIDRARLLDDEDVEILMALL